MNQVPEPTEKFLRKRSKPVSASLIKPRRQESKVYLKGRKGKGHGKRMISMVEPDPQLVEYGSTDWVSRVGIKSRGGEGA